MPTIDFNQLSALPISDLMFPEPTGAAAQSDSEKMFDDYLKRANTASKPPDADSRTATNRDVDRSAPPRADNVPQPAEHYEAAPQTSISRDREPSSGAPTHTGEDKPVAAEVSPSQPNEVREVQNNAKETKQEDPHDGEVQPSKKNVVKDKKNIKEEKNGSKPVAESSAAARKNSAALLVIQDVQPAKGTDAKEGATGESCVESERKQDVAETSLRCGDPVSKQGINSQVDANAAQSTSMINAQALQDNIETDGDQTATDNPVDTMNDVPGDGKSKAKKSRETAAEAKSTQRKHKLAGESPADASVQEASETSSAPAGKEAGDAAKAPSVMPQASASVMQSVLEVLKNAEKTAQTEDSVGPIADARANPSAQSAKTTAVREGGSAPASTGSDNASHAVRAQFVQRVERAFAAMGNRDGSVRLKLSPPELGVLKLEIGVHKGVMKARVEAETPAAKSLLLDHLPDLRERLAQQNIHIQQFDVDLMDRSPGGMPQQTFGQADSGSQQDHRSSQRTNTNENTTVGALSTASPQRAGMGGSLNVIV